VYFKEARNPDMAHAYSERAYTLAEIGREMGLHYSTLSHIIKAREGMSQCKMWPLIMWGTDQSADP
jgi:AraC-like DNA-binding protein